MTNPNTPNNSEGLYTDAAGLNTTDATNTANTETQVSSCGCGHHKPVETTEVREEIKIVPADHAANTTQHSCGCEPGQCQCGHHKTCDCAPNECHCGHNQGLQDAQHTETVETVETSAPAASCCGGHGHHGLTEEEYLDPDVTDENNVDPAVKTVEEATTYDQSAGWNDGIRPDATGEATESGAGNNESDQIN